MISLILAMDRNRVIGVNNDLPWYLPRDLRFFKEKTTGNTIIMGRKTFDSIGRVLPNRKHIVLTKQNADLPEEVTVIRSIDQIKEWNDQNPKKEYFVIGGSTVFEQILPIADRMYITFIDESFEGDTFFPIFNETDWELTSKVKGEKDEKNQYNYYFLQYNRKAHGDEQ
ncbi:MAG TPA: dihydrofolate reductase [Pseudogracilibacillus sp.]|nr:dihydrofolate reductase [Pseudogracilibacillus sp.]